MYAMIFVCIFCNRLLENCALSYNNGIQRNIFAHPVETVVHN